MVSGPIFYMNNGECINDLSMLLMSLCFLSGKNFTFFFYNNCLISLIIFITFFFLKPSLDCVMDETSVSFQNVYVETLISNELVF